MSLRIRMRRCALAVTLAAPAALALPAGAAAANGGAAPPPGPAAVSGTPAPAPRPAPAPIAPAVLRPDGTAVAPAGAPPEVAAVIAAANRIATKPYKWGGGHRRWEDRGYDCSGSVSYALRGAELVEWAYDSGGFMRWGEKGPGRWITIYANRGHAFMVVAGLRFDTSGARPSRWQQEPRPLRGFRVRHPAGL